MNASSPEGTAEKDIERRRDGKKNDPVADILLIHLPQSVYIRPHTIETQNQLLLLQPASLSPIRFR
jgi:hypothetical protein